MSAPELIIGFEGFARYFISRLDRLEGLIMALSEQEQASVQRLSDAIDDLDADVATAFSAAQTTNQALRDNITGLEAVRDTLQAEAAVDEATITGLNTQIDSLKATQQQNETDVVAALDSLTTKVGDTDKVVETIINP